MTIFDFIAFIVLPLLSFLLSPKQSSGTHTQEHTLRQGRSLPQRQSCPYVAHLFSFPIKKVEKMKWGLFFSFTDKQKIQHSQTKKKKKKIGDFAHKIWTHFSWMASVFSFNWTKLTSLKSRSFQHMTWKQHRGEHLSVQDSQHWAQAQMERDFCKLWLRFSSSPVPKHLGLYLFPLQFSYTTSLTQTSRSNIHGHLRKSPYVEVTLEQGWRCFCRAGNEGCPVFSIHGEVSKGSETPWCWVHFKRGHLMYLELRLWKTSKLLKKNHHKHPLKIEIGHVTHENKVQDVQLVPSGENRVEIKDTSNSILQAIVLFFFLRSLGVKNNINLLLLHSLQKKYVQKYPNCLSQFSSYLRFFPITQWSFTHQFAETMRQYDKQESHVVLSKSWGWTFALFGLDSIYNTLGELHLLAKLQPTWIFLQQQPGVQHQTGSIC